MGTSRRLPVPCYTPPNGTSCQSTVPGRNAAIDATFISRRRAGDGSLGTYYLLSPSR